MQRAFNGLGQLTAEYQEHGPAKVTLIQPARPMLEPSGSKRLAMMAGAPVGVFALGIAAYQWSREGRLPLRSVLPLVAGKLVLHPMLTWVVLAMVLKLEPFWVQAGVLYAALPIAANVFVIAERFDTGSRPLAAAIVLSTAAATLTFPLAIWLIS